MNFLSNGGFAFEPQLSFQKYQKHCPKELFEVGHLHDAVYGDLRNHRFWTRLLFMDHNFTGILMEKCSKSMGTSLLAMDSECKHDDITAIGLNLERII
jgi:hypothetical protein